MALHARILHNGEIRDAGESGLFPGQVGLLSGWGVFSTLRVKDGRLFAWERHWARMERDARLLNVAMPPDEAEIHNNLLRLIAANDIFDCTLRLVVIRNHGGLWEQTGSGRGASDVIALTADSKTWGESVRLSLQPHGRYSEGEFTQAKILSWAQNLRWAERAQEAGFDETILLNEHGRVAECTSANVFAIFGANVYTPPLSEGCLPGITREVLLREVRIPGVQISERALSVEDLYAADGVFITSTTRDLVGVREIAGKTLTETGSVRRDLADEFRKFLIEDIARRKPVELNP